MSARVLTPAECRALVARKSVGRVVYTDQALPTALPVNYAVSGNDIVFRTDPKGRLAATAARGTVLAFQVDEIDDAAEAGWSVLLVGLAERITAAADIARADGLGIVSWASTDGESVYIRIPMARIDGREVQRDAPVLRLA